MESLPFRTVGMWENLGKCILNFSALKIVGVGEIRPSEILKNTHFGSIENTPNFNDF